MDDNENELHADMSKNATSAKRKASVAVPIFHIFHIQKWLIHPKMIDSSKNIINLLCCCALVLIANYKITKTFFLNERNSNTMEWYRNLLTNFCSLISFAFIVEGEWKKHTHTTNSCCERRRSKKTNWNWLQMANNCWSVLNVKDSSHQFNFIYNINFENILSGNTEGNV